MLLKLKEIPKIKFEELSIAYEDLSFLDQVKYFFSKNSFPETFRGRSLSEDIIVEDNDNILDLDTKYNVIKCVYQSKPDKNNVVSNTVYDIYGLIPYGLLRRWKSLFR